MTKTESVVTVDPDAPPVEARAREYLRCLDLKLGGEDFYTPVCQSPVSQQAARYLEVNQDREADSSKSGYQSGSRSGRRSRDAAAVLMSSGDYRSIWHQKPVLRKLYSGFYRRMADTCRPGATLEIGGGSGNFKAFAPHVVSTDILFASWLDSACDAQALPFREGSFDNVVMMDVFHHLERPTVFLREALRVLKPGGGW